MIVSRRGAPAELESERLILRAPDPKFGAAVAAGINESFEELHRFMEWAEKRATVEDSTVRQRASRAEFLSGEHHAWLLFRKEDDAFVGICGMPRPRWDEATLEIGYWLRTSQVGKGYMTEAVRRVTRLSFEVLGAKRLEIQMSDQNLRSVSVAERAGYRWAETRTGEVHPDGSPRTTRVYVLEPHEAGAL